MKIMNANVATTTTIIIIIVVVATMKIYLTMTMYILSIYLIEIYDEGNTEANITILLSFHKYNQITKSH